MAEAPCAAFEAIASLCIALGQHPLTKHAGCWEQQIDERWWIAMNGHRAPVKCSAGAEVPPFHCYVQFNGWPAALFGPNGGVIAAGECANEDAFIQAVRARHKKEVGRG